MNDLYPPQEQDLLLGIARRTLEVVTAGIGRPDRFCYRLPASSGNGIDNA